MCSARNFYVSFASVMQCKSNLRIIFKLFSVFTVATSRLSQHPLLD
uniref:Uncharacterized protein n=1 Tax=Rhizophora mucronata TaxID=61149 RepID=A0A2P2QZ44_RHIMU